METARKKLLEYAEKNPTFVTEAIEEVVEGKDLSEYTTEEVVLEYLSIEIVKKLVQRFDNIMEQNNV